MGEHIDTKKQPNKRHRKGFAEGQDIASQRHRRVSFKNYLNELEEELLDEELSADDSDLNESK